MNKARRKELEMISEQLDTCKAEIETLMEDEQNAYDSLPESFQNGEKGEAMQNAIDQMSEAIDNVQNAMDCLVSAQE